MDGKTSQGYFKTVFKSGSLFFLREIAVHVYSTSSSKKSRRNHVVEHFFHFSVNQTIAKSCVNSIDPSFSQQSPFLRMKCTIIIAAFFQLQGLLRKAAQKNLLQRNVTIMIHYCTMSKIYNVYRSRQFTDAVGVSPPPPPFVVFLLRATNYALFALEECQETYVLIDRAIYMIILSTRQKKETTFWRRRRKKTNHFLLMEFVFEFRGENAASVLVFLHLETLF